MHGRVTHLELGPFDALEAAAIPLETSVGRSARLPELLPAHRSTPTENLYRHQ